MSTTNDTPRTDRFDCCYVNGKHARLVPANFARELERELAHERAKVAELVAALEGIVAMSPANHAPPLQLRARNALERIGK